MTFAANRGLSLEQDRPQRPFSRYFRPCPYGEIDLYRVFLIFGIDNPAVQHAIKKLAFAGQRGGKGYEQDIREAIVSAERALELHREDCEVATENEARSSQFEQIYANGKEWSAETLYLALRAARADAQVELESEVLSQERQDQRGRSAVSLGVDSSLER